MDFVYFTDGAQGAGTQRAKGAGMKIHCHFLPVSRRLHGWHRPVRKVAHALQGTVVSKVRGNPSDSAC
jgi:hypothetical protein